MLTAAQRQELLARVGRVLDDIIRPELEADGGAIDLVGIDEDRIVQVRLGGSCPGCGASSYAITMRIEAEVKTRVPEICFIEAVP